MNRNLNDIANPMILGINAFYPRSRWAAFRTLFERVSIPHSIATTSTVPMYLGKIPDDPREPLSEGYMRGAGAGYPNPELKEVTPKQTTNPTATAANWIGWLLFGMVAWSTIKLVT